MMLYEAAQSMLVRSTKWSWLKAWAMKVAKHRGMKKAIVALARRLAVITNAGIVGWGEASPWSVFTGTAEANASAIHLYMRPLVVGPSRFNTGTRSHNDQIGCTGRS